MWAELVVEHVPCADDPLRDLIVTVFGADDDRATLANSINFSKKSWHDRVLYCKNSASYLVIVMTDGNDEFVTYIEVTGQGTILEACQSVWKKLERALRTIEPELRKLRLSDAESGRFLFGHAASFNSELKRREVFAPIVVGLLTLGFFLLAIFTWERDNPDRFKLLYGAMAGAFMAIVIVGSVVYDVYIRKSLRWSDEDKK